MNAEKMARIRALNDRLRTTGYGGRTMITSGIASLDPTLRWQIVRAMRADASFNDASDPYGEHDFGALDVGNHLVFWKIDYYDTSLSAGAADPACDATTTRVLTLMLAEEY